MKSADFTCTPIHNETHKQVYDVIGTLNEWDLHAQVKEWLAQPGDQFEVPLKGYVIDLVRGEQLIEIQTANFGRLSTKLSRLLPEHPVTVVYPIAAERWIMKQGKRRKSPKRGTLYDVFDELVALPTSLDHPNLSLEMLLVQDEIRREYDPSRKHRRRRGWVTTGRKLLTVQDWVRVEKSAELLLLLPETLPDPFTTADLAQHATIPRRRAQQMTYCLHKLNLIARVGKQKNAHKYRRI